MFLALAVCAPPGARADAVATDGIATDGDDPSVADDVRLEAESWWPEVPPKDAWRPVAVLLLPTGGMIVADQAQGRLFQLGNARLGLDRLPSPDRPVVEWTALAPAVGLSFFALDGPGGFVHQYDYSGNYLGVAADLNLVADAEGLGPVDAAGMAVDRAGQILISDRLGDRILVFDASWNLTDAWGETGDALGQWRRPGALAVGRRAPYLVADEGNRRLVLVDELGEVVDYLDTDEPARGVAVFDDRYVAVFEDRVDVYDQELFLVGSMTLPRAADCTDSPYATGAVAGGKGRIFVGEGCSGRILGIRRGGS